MLSDFVQLVGNLVESQLLNVYGLVLEEGVVLSLLVGRDQLVSLRVDRCAAREKQYLVSDALADISLSQESHDTLVDPSQILLDNFKFAFSD